MASTDAPAKPRSRNTVRPASSSASRVAACFSARVAMSGPTVGRAYPPEPLRSRAEARDQVAVGVKCRLRRVVVAQQAVLLLEVGDVGVAVAQQEPAVVAHAVDAAVVAVG